MRGGCQNEGPCAKYSSNCFAKRVFPQCLTLISRVQSVGAQCLTRIVRVQSVSAQCLPQVVRVQSIGAQCLTQIVRVQSVSAQRKVRDTSCVSPKREYA